MSERPPRTGTDTIVPLASARPARGWSQVVLLGLAVLLALGLRQGETFNAPLRASTQPSDSALHTRVIARLVKGQPYYAAVGAELREAGYPARSVFNWRTPAHYTLVAILTPRRATTLLRILSLAVIVGAMWVLARLSMPRSFVAGFLMLGSTLVPLMLADAVVFAEACAGTVIGLSLALYGRFMYLPAACLALAALFFREIALPYAVTCGLLAIWQRRRAESLFWVAGGFAYLIYYGLHAANVARHIDPADVAHAQSWLQFQGLPFVLRTLHGNGIIVLVPAWVTVILCVLGLAGTFAPSIPRAVKWPLLAYCAFFAVAGQGFNFYWGWVAIPLWAYAIAHADIGLRHLVSHAFSPAPVGRASGLAPLTDPARTNR